MHRAIAHCALDRVPEMEANVASYLTLFTFKTPERAERRKKMTMRRVLKSAGKPVPEEYVVKIQKT